MLPIFQSRTLIIATKHGKERVMAPLLESSLGVCCLVAHDLDTDLFGTFSGEIERPHDVVTTLRNKCLKAMELYDCDLAIASEGSFGPHPSSPFVPADDELVLLYDRKNNFEILERHLTMDTNFDSATVSTFEELIRFSSRVGFPQHGLIIRKSVGDQQPIKKGIVKWRTLKSEFHRLIKTCRSVCVETDMRAMYNPTRMRAIEKATKNLIEKVNSQCPQCQTPGFGVTSVIRGLPCSDCGAPTPSPLGYCYSCVKCSYAIQHPVEAMSEDPGLCDRCNP